MTDTMTTAEEKVAAIMSLVQTLSEARFDCGVAIGKHVDRHSVDYDEPFVRVGESLVALKAAIRALVEERDEYAAKFHAAMAEYERRSTLLKVELADAEGERDVLRKALDDTSQWFHHQQHLWSDSAAKHYTDCFVAPCVGNKRLTVAHDAEQEAR